MPNFQELSSPVGEEMIENAGMITERSGDELIMDEAFIVGDVCIDAEAGCIDKIPVIDPDDIDLMDAIGQGFPAGPEKVISRSVRNEREDVMSGDQVFQKQVHSTVSADGRDDIIFVLILF